MESAARDWKVRRDAGDAEVRGLAEAVRRGRAGPVVPAGHPRGPLGMGSPWGRFGAVKAGEAACESASGEEGEGARGWTHVQEGDGARGVAEGGRPALLLEMAGIGVAEKEKEKEKEEEERERERERERGGLVQEVDAQGVVRGRRLVGYAPTGPASFVPHGSRFGRHGLAAAAAVLPGTGGPRRVGGPGSERGEVARGGSAEEKEEGEGEEGEDGTASARGGKPADEAVAEELASVFHVAGRGGVSGGFNGSRVDGRSGSSGGSRSKRSGGLSSVTGVKSHGRRTSAPRAYPGHGMPTGHEGALAGLQDTAASRTPPHLAAAQLAGALPAPRSPLSSFR